VQGRWQTLIGETTPERAGFAGTTLRVSRCPPEDRRDETPTGLAERSLQPGTGTTQLAADAYFREALPMMNSSWYAQARVLPWGTATTTSPA
jgi:hypothetical protein